MKQMPLLAALSLFAASATAAPIEVSRTQLQMSGNNCLGSLPSHEGQVRKRPLGLANEGTATVFITCALTADDGASGNPHVGTRLTNRGDVAATINCTLVNNSVYWVNGTAGYPPPTYFPRTLVLQPAESGLMHWSKDMNGGTNFYNNVNMSCALPPGVEMNYNYRNYMEQTAP